MLTVACVFVQGHVDFTPEYVTRLKGMVTRFCPVPFRFVCLTDRPELLPGVETRRIPSPQGGMFGWWSKLELFNRAHFTGAGRILYLDLDVLVVGDLGDIIDYPAPFAAVPDAAPNFKGRGARVTVKRYNSSVMSYDAGFFHLYDRFAPAIAERLWGDQDWIGEQMPDGETMPLAWFPRLSETQDALLPLAPWPAAAKVILCKKPKNEGAAKCWAGFDRQWG